VPIKLLAPLDFSARYRMELSSPQVAITIHGPEALLYDLLPENDVTAYVLIRSAGETGIARDVAVALIGPSWMTYDPVTIRATTHMASSHPQTNR
jgi:hypothetical protein